MKGILGKKLGMTEVFTKEGKAIPVTVVEVEPNTVMQVKTKENDGYNALQLGICDKKSARANKASMGHAKKAGATPKRYLKEIRDFEGSYNLGDKIDASVFAAGEYVDVTGVSKGHGFEGSITRHGQSRGPMTHGSDYHRRPGSMGTMLPKRVLKGKRLPGHMGVDTTTIQNLYIVDVNTEDNYILVSGNIPGAKQSLVLIKSAVKKDKKAAEELASYEEETVVDTVEEVTETPEEVSEPATEEVVEETKEETAEEETSTEEVPENQEGEN